MKADRVTRDIISIITNSYTGLIGVEAIGRLKVSGVGADHRGVGCITKIKKRITNIC